MTEFFFIVPLCLFLIFLLTAWLVLKKLLYICQPNEVLIFAGSPRRFGLQTVAYRLNKGGRGLRLPLLEQVYRLDLTDMVLELSLQDVLSEEMIPLEMEVVAHVKIAGEEPLLFRAAERLLGKSRSEIVDIASLLLEGTIRIVVSSFRPEEIVEDRLAFQQQIVEEGEADLASLGLELNTLNIQHIRDTQGYLELIQRKRRAQK